MDISVVIPAHRRTDLLIQCLASLARSRQGGCAYEVCVVDDGSGMDESVIRMAAAPDYPLVWRRFPSQRGRAAARNEGVKVTAGGIVVFLDADMTAEPGFIAAHAALHRNRPRTAAVGSIEWPASGSFYRYIGSRGAAKLPPGSSLPPWFFVTGNASISRADLPPVPFDESLDGWGGEDLDLGMRLAAAGIAFVSLPDARTRHAFTGDLEEHLRRTEAYGRRTVPMLIGRYPALVAVLRLHLLARTSWRVAVSGTIAGPVGWAVRRLDRFPLPDSLFDYLTFSAYARGWLDARRI